MKSYFLDICIFGVSILHAVLSLCEIDWVNNYTKILGYVTMNVNKIIKIAVTGVMVETRVS